MTVKFEPPAEPAAVGLHHELAAAGNAKVADEASVVLAEAIAGTAPIDRLLLKAAAGAGKSHVLKRLVIEAVKPQVPGCGQRGYEPAWFAWEGLLFARGYEFALFDGLNRFYHRREEPQLRELLSYPANVTDGFALMPGHFLARPLQAAG